MDLQPKRIKLPTQLFIPCLLNIQVISFLTLVPYLTLTNKEDIIHFNKHIKTYSACLFLITVYEMPSKSVYAKSSALTI